jgi:uncharacterized membrane protein
VTAASGGHTAERRVDRLVHLDWLRGLAVVFMISWHVIESWTIPDDRESVGFATAIFFAGWAAPMFLFLAGMALPLAARSRMARGADRETAARALQRRGWQVFLLAHLFRLQSYVFSSSRGSPTALLKPDILNVLGLSIVAVGYCWGRAGTSSAGLRRWLLGPAILIVLLLAPLAPTWWWPALLHPRLEAYIRPVGHQGVFTLFPAMGYVFVGGFVGTCIAQWKSTSDVMHAHIAGWGAALLVTGLLLGMPPSPDWLWFWTGHFSLVTGRIGAMMLAMAVCWLALRHRPPDRWSPMVLLGRTSLVVYWVHVEIAYSGISRNLHRALPLSWSVAGFVGVTLLMLGLSWVWSHTQAQVRGRAFRARIAART